MRKLPRSLDVSLPSVVGVARRCWVGDGDDGGVATPVPGMEVAKRGFLWLTVTGIMVTQS
jgi:hypothetical protein